MWISVLTHVAAFIAGGLVVWLVGFVMWNLAFRNWWGP